MCWSSRAEKPLMAKPRWAALIGVPQAAASHSDDSPRRRRSCPWTRRMRIDSFQPSACWSRPPGKKTSVMCRMFCPRRRAPRSRTRPVSMKDLAMLVVNPLMSTPVTNAARTVSELRWNMRMPGPKAS